MHQQFMMAFLELPGEYVVDGVHFSPPTTMEVLTDLKNLELTSDDVLVIGYPRTGSMWVQNLLYHLHHPEPCQAANDFILARVPQLEVPLDGLTTAQWMDKLHNHPKPRLYKTHLRPSILGENIMQSNCKMVLVLRNPKDTLVSFFHLSQQVAVMGSFKGNWNQFFDGLVSQKKFLFGDWFDFATKWWQTLHCKPNALIVKYEDLKHRPTVELKRIAEFCNLNLTDSTVADIAMRAEFEKSKESDSLGLRQSFLGEESVEIMMRKGIVGGWKGYFNQEQNDYIDSRLEVLKRETGLEFEM